ncbi:hypothetical protein CPB83DRAFT_407341 [Crepidotus variabilis]|uniref:Uncharacterized protein n=1 Tax=Crepidotus variabilis TaxID=179855 RepID=A0A9P6EPR3_9AGAR|nr:hypothetical protein CPB83DRAFT_407341 [Crepidotus variabilis]
MAKFKDTSLANFSTAPLALDGPHGARLATTVYIAALVLGYAVLRRVALPRLSCKLCREVGTYF